MQICFPISVIRSDFVSHSPMILGSEDSTPKDFPSSPISAISIHIAKLVDKQFTSVENTTYIDKHGMKWNGNNQHTIQLIQAAMDYCYRQQMRRLEERQKWQQAQALLAQGTKNAPCAPL